MVLIAVRVAELHMSADETLLVAEQNHDLKIEKEDCIRQISDTFLSHREKSKCWYLHVARTCCDGSCPRHPLCCQDPQVQCLAR